MSSDDDKKDLLETFKALDVNSDGMISRKELLEGYRKVTTAELNDDQLNEMFDNIDKDGSGVIEYSEFVAATINRQNMLGKQRLKQVFRLFDKDGSGTLTIDELQ